MSSWLSRMVVSLAEDAGWLTSINRRVVRSFLADKRQAALRFPFSMLLIVFTGSMRDVQHQFSMLAGRRLSLGSPLYSAVAIVRVGLRIVPLYFVLNGFAEVACASQSFGAICDELRYYMYMLLCPFLFRDVTNAFRLPGLRGPQQDEEPQKPSGGEEF